MILTYPSYIDQTQIIGLNTILDYHGSAIIVETPYPLNITVAQSLEYGISLSQSLEYGISLSQSGGGS